MKLLAVGVAGLALVVAPVLMAMAGAPPAPPGSIEANKRLILHWLEDGDNKGQVELADEVFSPDVVIYHPAQPAPIRGVPAIKAQARSLIAGFKGYHGTIEDVIGEGDKVTVRWTVRGLHVAPFMGIPATQKKIEIKGISIYRFAGGKIVEGWYSADMLGLMQQLGLIPTPKAP